VRFFHTRAHFRQQLPILPLPRERKLWKPRRFSLCPVIFSSVEEWTAIAPTWKRGWIVALRRTGAQELESRL
jgi:hypothetical protein